MPITINGTGSITGISAGGLPDGSITAPDLSGAQTGTAPIYGCRAWVNFDGTRNEADTGASTNGANVKIRASGNVTSVLKNAVGDYTVNFTTAMPDANYCPQGSCNGVSGTSHQPHFFGASRSTADFTTTSLRFLIEQGGSLTEDRAVISVAIFR